MEGYEYDLMNFLEKDYWWFKNKRYLVRRLIKRFTKKKQLRILDIGCGTGLMMKYLMPLGHVKGIDSSDLAVRYCKEKNLSVSVLSAEHVDQIQEKFDVVIMSDVLEHLEDDVDVIKKVKTILNKEGIFVITVPAFPSLWGVDDISLHHKRRYAKKELSRKLRSQNFTISYFNYNHSLMFIPTHFLRKHEPEGSTDVNDSFEKKFKKKLFQNHTPSLFMNDFLYTYSVIETTLLQIVPAPFGTSIVCVAKV